MKPCFFVGSARRDLVAFPENVRVRIGYALDMAQRGEEPRSAKALRGFGGRGVLELIENHMGDTYRAVYTVRFQSAVYVLHCFLKKSKKGAVTPQHDMDVIRARMQAAEVDDVGRTGPS